MKMKYFFLMCVVGVLAACSDEKNEGPAYAGKIAGTYTGYSMAVFQYVPDPVYTADQEVKVTAVSENTVNVSYTDATWGTYRLENADVVYTDGQYTVSGSGKVSLGMGSSAAAYDYTLSAVLKETELSLKITLPAVMGGLDIVFTSGETPAAVQIMGEYTGTVNVAFQYSPTPQVYPNDTLNLTATAEGIRFSYKNADWGTYEIENMEVIPGNGVYLFSGQDSVTMGMNGTNVRKYLFTLEGEIDAVNGKAAFVVKVPAVMGGVTLTFSEGIKQEEE